MRAVDGSSTGIIHCEDKKALDQWIKHIQNHITSLNYKSIKMSNKYLHKSEQVNYYLYLFGCFLRTYTNVYNIHLPLRLNYERERQQSLLAINF